MQPNRPPHSDLDDEAAQPPTPPGIASRREVAPNPPPFGGLPSRSEISSTRYPNHAPPAKTYSSDRNDEVQAALPVAPPTSSPPPTAPFPSSNVSTRSASTSSVLTPASGTAGTDGTSPSPGINGSSSQQSPVGGLPMFYPHGTWPTPAASGYNYSSNSPASGGGYARSSFSNSLASPQLPQFSVRAPASPANGEDLPGTSAFQDHPAYSSAAGGSGGGGSGGPGSNGGGAASTGVNGGAGSFGSTTLNSQHHGSASSGLVLPILGGSGQTGAQHSASQSTMGAPATGSEGHIYRSSSTPNGYYPPGSSPQQAAFPYASQPGPSPTIPTGPLPGRSPMMPAMPPSPMYPGPSRPNHMPPVTYNQYSNMPGPILSNVHQPNHPMATIYGPAHHYAMDHHMYLNNNNQPQRQQQDRPFKCETCPQSFNRNHDLKRHTRIHLAVKPFPCDTCEKTFSRKDALKRHKLVRGCNGKDKSTPSTKNPDVKGESPGTSDGDGNSPVAVKKDQ